MGWLELVSEMCSNKYDTFSAHAVFERVSRCCLSPAPKKKCAFAFVTCFASEPGEGEPRVLFFYDVHPLSFFPGTFFLCSRCSPMWNKSCRVCHEDKCACITSLEIQRRAAGCREDAEKSLKCVSQTSFSLFSPPPHFNRSASCCWFDCSMHGRAASSEPQIVVMETKFLLVLRSARGNVGVRSRPSCWWSLAGIGQNPDHPGPIGASLGCLESRCR